jgi:hypothetical protein
MLAPAIILAVIFQRATSKDADFWELHAVAAHPRR